MQGSDTLDKRHLDTQPAEAQPDAAPGTPCGAQPASPLARQQADKGATARLHPGVGIGVDTGVDTGVDARVETDNLSALFGSTRGLHAALRRALRRVDALGHGTTDARALPLYRSVAVLYALLGHDEDAQEWFARSLRPIEGRLTLDAVSATDTLRAALAYLGGGYVATIRLVNNALTRHSRRAGDRHRNLLIALLAAAYLRLGQLTKAEQCVDAVLNSRGRTQRDAGFTLALLLRGEINLWAILRTDPCFRGQLLFVDDLPRRSLDRAARATRARLAFEEVAGAANVGFPLKEMAEAGLACTRLVLEPLECDWEYLQRHVQLMTTEGLAHLRDLARLDLSVLYLVHGRSREARSWLTPLAEKTLARPGEPFEHDVLFCAAMAAERSGDSHRALAFLSEYNVRIRAQHLTRVPLPPPNVATQTAPPCIPVEERRVSQVEDSALVARVTALVRNHPANPAHSLQLAAMEGISRRTLEYKFRRQTGKSPKEFVTAIRLEMAYGALSNQAPEEPGMLAALAKSLGFRNYRAFARAFRKTYGFSPAQSLETASESGGPGSA